MRNVISFLGTILIIAIQAAAVSALFCGFKWLFSLLSICDAPGWREFVGGGIVLFILFFLFSVYKTFNTMRRLKKKCETIEWKEVDTEPVFNVGDIYQIYDKASGWHTVKVVSPSDAGNGFTEVLIDDGKTPEMFPKTVIMNCWWDGFHKKNNLV